MASVSWNSNALGNLEELDPIIRQRVLAKISWLEENFADTIPERLHRELKGLYKVRIGDYRAVYSVHGDLITIEAVGHRREIYK